MAYNTIFANLPGAPATNPASIIDAMFNRVGQIAVVPCDTVGTNSLTLTPQANTPPIPAYTNHSPVFSTITPNASTNLVTAQVGALAQIPVYKTDMVTQLAANDLRANGLMQLVFESSLAGGAGGFVSLGNPGPSATTGAINGGVQIKTTTYAVTNNDKGSTITVNNNTQTTISAGAASGYDANFQVRIYNGNTLAGLLISFPGVSIPPNNFLYPGQSIVIQNINNAWSLQNNPGRWQKSGAIFNVDPVNGSDTLADGLSTGTRAFLTIQGAYSNATTVVDTIGGFGTIQLSAAVYSLGSGLQFSYPVVGKSAILIKGDPSNLTTAANYVLGPSVAGSYCATARDLCTVLWQGVTFTTFVAGGGAMSASNNATMDADTCVFAGFSSTASVVSVASGGTIGFLNTAQMSTNCAVFMVASEGGVITAGIPFVVPSVVTFTAFMEAVSAGVIELAGGSFSGSGAGSNSNGQKWITTTAGGINSGGVTIPGSSAGVAIAPGWFT